MNALLPFMKVSPTLSSAARVRLARPSTKYRQWFLLVATALLILINQYWISLDGPLATAIAAILILLVGLPHGTLDVEIAVIRFGAQSSYGKCKIIAAYVSCAALMAGLWFVLPSLALTLFLVLSIVHFGADWRKDDEAFFAIMVGWALIALPALSHPKAVATIFETLTGDQSGAAIAAILACTSIPAICGSLIFAVRAINRPEPLVGINVISCLFAAALLPPLAGFAVFFCGLHSPRHLAEAVRQSGVLPRREKALHAAAVMALSVGAAVVLFRSQGQVSIDTGIVRTAFILLSILTVPHFILEQFGTDSALEPQASPIYPGLPSSNPLSDLQNR